jgi:membrane protease YdiL (CAAX protease family)
VAAERRPETARLAAFLTLATLAQLAFWRLATPGPLLLDGAERGPAYAAGAIGWSVATLLVAALASGPLLHLRPAGLGLAWGRSGRGLLWAGAAAALAVPVLWLQGTDPALSAAYPWISAGWLDAGPWRWTAWAAAYALYYLAYEAFYRGAVLHALRGRLGDGAANVAQAMLATLIHVGKPLSETVAAFPASLAFGWLTLRFRSIVPALALHLAIGLAMDAAVVARGAG